MKEKALFLLLSFIAGIIGVMMSWLCVKFMERSVVFKLNKRLFNRKDWWQEKLEARRTELGKGIAEEFKLRHGFNGFLQVQNFQTRFGDINTVTTLTFRSPDTVILTFVAPIPGESQRHYYLTFDLNDYGYDPSKDYETEALVIDIIRHAVVERLKRI